MNRVFDTNDARVRAVAFTTLLLAACQDNAPLEPGCELPTVVTTQVAPNPNNVLSAIVTVTTSGTDSVAVRYGPANGALDSSTPSVVAEMNSSIVPVLGLWPSAGYSLQAVAFNACGSAEGATIAFTTGDTPLDLPSYSASGSDPTPGYTAFAAGSYGVVIDNSGRVVWYHRFPNGPGLSFQAQPNGTYAARPSAAQTGVAAAWVELDPLGNATRTLGCARGLDVRVHDLIARPDGSYWIMCDEVRTLDLSGIGGQPNAAVMGTVVQNISASGSLLFEWSPFDHFSVSPAAAQGQAIGEVMNWTHGNAFDIDGDGNLLLSFRNLSELTKVDTKTGAVIWRMGGEHSEFTFEALPEAGFFQQHGIRAGAGTEFTILDNLGNEAESRVERYEYDEQQRTVRLLSSYPSSPPVIGRLGGSTQWLPAGHILASFGNGAAVEEYGPDGGVVWRMDGNPGYVFRALRIRSLYAPGKGDGR